MRIVKIRDKMFGVTTDQDIFWNEVEQGKWEQETFDVLDYFIEPNKTFIDIGAWNGVCSIYAHSLGANIECVEPDEVIQKTLEKNVYNNCEEFDIWECAISDNDVEVSLNSFGQFGDSMSSVLNREGQSGNNVKVKSWTLQSFIEMTLIKPKDICLIKMDIEGGELLVLKQAKKYLELHKPTIYLSLHPAWFPNKMEDMQSIIDVIFPIYRACKLVDGVLTQYSRDNFLKAVDSGVHSWILISK